MALARNKWRKVNTIALSVDQSRVLLESWSMLPSGSPEAVNGDTVSENFDPYEARK